tara:strand:+ start:296 stop:568 length:273 start_codon:yes stop_codon:yes gene_type:complete
MNRDEKEIREKILKGLVDTNDAVLIIIGNYIDEADLELDFAVNTEEHELFEIFSELFKNKALKGQARKALLYSDYGDGSADLNGLNNLIN